MSEVQREDPGPERDTTGAPPPAGFKPHEYLVNGVRTVVQIGGSGRPVVYWHGAGCWHGLDFARAWTDRMKVIAPYHPGWGASDDAPELDSIGEYLLHYLDLFDQLNLGQFDLVGFSLGGWMAAEFAVAHTQRVRRLVLVAPAGLPDPRHPGPPMGEWTLEEMYSYIANDRSVLAPHLPQNPAAEARHAETIAREMRSTRRLAPHGPFNPHLARWLHRLHMPTLLVWSKDDRLAPVGRAEQWMERLPNAKLALFERAGHLVLDELAEARDCVAKFLA
ncbi:MAG TPA: alpha/beta hydrolase [Steroidobacteraceae bacterium]|nr:alpha/beta hydrolase [Steroidobacteraceae bacterium]